MRSSGDRDGFFPCLLSVVALIFLLGMKEHTRFAIVTTAFSVVDVFGRMQFETCLLFVPLSLLELETSRIVGSSLCIIRIA